MKNTKICAFVISLLLNWFAYSMEQKTTKLVKSLKHRAGEVLVHNGQLHKIEVLELKHDVELSQELKHVECCCFLSDYDNLCLIVNNMQDLEQLAKIYRESESSVIRLYRKCSVLQCQNLMKLLLKCYLRVTDRSDVSTKLMQAAVFNNKTMLLEHIEVAEQDLAIFYEPFMTMPLVEAARYNNYEMVEFLLINGAKVDSCDIDGRTPLMVAAANGYLELVRLLLEHDALIDAEDGIGMTAVLLATERGHVAIVDHLLYKGAELNAKLFNPLVLATKFGNSELVTTWLDKCTQDQISRALIEAANLGHVEVAKLLLSHGANPDYMTGLCTKSPLMFACECAHPKMVELLLAHHADVNKTNNLVLTPVLAAATGGDIDILKLLIERGAHYHATVSDGENALMRAARFGHIGLVSYLIDLGFDIHETDDNGNTALGYAVRNNQRDVAAFLLDLGADINIVHSGEPTAFKMAITSGYTELIKLLLERNVQLDWRNASGRTLLHYATDYYQCEIAELLLAQGADVNAVDNNGNTALYRAVLMGREGIIKILLKHNADTTIVNNQGDTAELRAQLGGMTPLLQLINDHKNKLNNLDKK